MNKTEFIVWASKLQPDYKANPAVLAKLTQVELVAFIGPTGVGKTTLMQASGIPHVASDVTRDMRSGEKDGREYFFRKDYDKLAEDIKNGEFVQYVINSNGEFYGTRSSSYPDIGPGAMAVIAQAIPNFRKLGFKRIVPLYILPPSYVEWMHRIGSARSMDLQARLDEARFSLPIAVDDPDYQFILNDTVDNAVADIKSVLADETVNQHRASLARETAEVLIGRLGETAP